MTALRPALNRSGWPVHFRALLCLGCVGGKDRLEPIRRAAAANPRACRGHGTPKQGGELGRAEVEALLPGHAGTLPEKKKERNA